MIGVVVLCAIALCLGLVEAAQSSPSTNPRYIYLSGCLRDQAPDRMNLCGSSGPTANGGAGFPNTDFEIAQGYLNSERGLVGPECNKSNLFTNCSTLGLDQTPVYAYPGMSPGLNIRSPQSFYTWFHSSNQSLLLPLTISLPQSNVKNIYSYSNDEFFPIDGQGWKDWCWDSTDPTDRNRKKHNYAFCFEGHTRFGYRGGETFSFFGDDDLWIFINNKLVIDLGALHPKEQKSVNLDDIPGLQKGTNYRLDFFYCERHTIESHLQLTTSLQFYCSYSDWCGMCEGNGQSCCTKEIRDRYVDDYNNCTIDFCGQQGQPGDPDWAQHIPVTCPKSKNACQISYCDPKLGCTISTLGCDDGDACTKDWCDPSCGCQHSKISCDDKSLCTTDTCDTILGCQHKSIVCNDSNACTIDTCHNATGCEFKTAPPCNDSNACTNDTCNPAIGCVFQSMCYDGNNCTTDTCNPLVGCSFLPVVCQGNGCLNSTCNPSTGTCALTPRICPDRDMCYLTSCANDTGCVYTPKICNDFNECTIDSCNPAIGCVFANRTCDDNNACTNDTCNPQSGCVYTEYSYDDGNLCTDDYCDALTGPYRINATCDDFNDCTIDSCSPQFGCQFVQKNCDDGNICATSFCFRGIGCIYSNITDCQRCFNGTQPIQCITRDSCLPMVCDSVNGGCMVNTNFSCNDNNACTVDRCVNGTCEHSPVPVCLPRNFCEISFCDDQRGCVYLNRTCNDGNVCTNDVCNAATASCENPPIAPYCETCGTTPCAYSDPCNPLVCNQNTLQCEPAPVNCNDQNLCTSDSCVVVNGNATCSNVFQPCADSGNLCNPNKCDPVIGCYSDPVLCEDFNPCTNNTCAAINGTARCVFPPVLCNNGDACNPQTCNVSTGQCDTHPVICTDTNACSNESCAVINGNATCVYDLKVCPNDACGPQICNTTTGACMTTRRDCNDFNPCTLDVSTCNGTSTVCSNTIYNFCNDNNACTDDFCDSNPNATTPCPHRPIQCNATNQCQRSVGCDPSMGCMFANVTCTGGDGVCNISKCDPRAGCIVEMKVCTVDDPECFEPVCDPTLGPQNPCTQARLPEFDQRYSKYGPPCIILYDDAARSAVISVGAFVGIALGAIAAAGVISYSGKLGWQRLNAMRLEPLKGITENPLYENPNRESVNPIYRFTPQTALDPVPSSSTSSTTT